MDLFDRQEYRDIPIYEIGCESSWTLPISIRRYNEQNFKLSPFHRHRVFQINYLARGRLLHKINNQLHELVKGDLIIIPPYVPHQLIGIGEQGHEVVELEFEPALIFNEGLVCGDDINESRSTIDFLYIEPFLVSEGEVKPRLNLCGEDQKRAEQLFEVLEAEQCVRGGSFILAMKAALLTLLVIMMRSFHKVHMDTADRQLFERYRESVERAVRYMHAHYSERLSLSQVAGVTYLSPSYFSYLFKAMMGKTFVEYLNGLRLEHAMELLEKTDKLVGDICAQTGFQSVHHFSRLFRAKVGVSPVQYRQARSDAPVFRHVKGPCPPYRLG